jgi:hypothetical protein
VDFTLDLRHANLTRSPAKSLKLFLEIEFSLIYGRHSKTRGLGTFIYFIVYTIAKQKQLVKLYNKQLKRQLDSLKSKYYQYRKLENIDLALIIQNYKKKEIYIYILTD